MMPRYIVASCSGYLSPNAFREPGVTFQVFDLDYMRVVALFRSEKMYGPGRGRGTRLHRAEAREEAQRRARALAHELNVLDEAA